MTHFINKFKIPTLLGLTIITTGIGIGIFLVLKEQTFISGASPDIDPFDITFSNISENSVALSWQTNTEVASFVIFGQSNPNEQIALEDSDKDKPKPHKIHYATLKNLLPKTAYQLQIISGKKPHEVLTFETAPPPTIQTGFAPIIGTVLDDNKPITEGVVYLSIAGAGIQSSPIKPSGTYLIPVSQIRKSDLSDTYPLNAGQAGKLTVISNKGKAQILFKLKLSSNDMPPVKAGENIDLTVPQPIIYDLNGDGQVNAADNAIILQNFGSNPKEKRADLNSDGLVNQEDLDLISKQINQ